MKATPENEKPFVSVVCPVYKGEKTLRELVERVDASLKKISAFYEIILVDDHSLDGSWEKIIQLAGKYPAVKGIRLSRNFGQHYAITAGLEKVKGEWVVVMDCDL
jgi:polyisoprenyl-phosphate glycosyltransferase